MIKIALHHYLVDFALIIFFDRIHRNFIDQIMAPIIEMSGNNLKLTVGRVVNGHTTLTIFTIYDFPLDVKPDDFASDLCGNSEFTYLSDSDIKQLIELKYGFVCTVEVDYI